MVRLVVKQGAVLIAIALAIGLPAALALAGLLRTMVFEIGTADPFTFLATSAVLAGVALLACWLPARRASSIDPVDAMRRE